MNTQITVITDGEIDLSLGEIGITVIHDGEIDLSLGGIGMTKQRLSLESPLQQLISSRSNSN